MLLRLQYAFGYADQAQPRVLIPGKGTPKKGGNPSGATMNGATINLVVGYNGSPNSLTALDLTLWMAHQTRLATRQSVMVHVVYVIQGKEFEQADRILYQARCLAEEWRGSFNTHLHFGETAAGLKQVAIAENAEILVLGCHSEQHPLVRQLGSKVPFPVLGLPCPVASAKVAAIAAASV